MALDARLIGCGEELTYGMLGWCGDRKFEGHPLTILNDFICRYGELMLVSGDMTRIGGITKGEIT